MSHQHTSTRGDGGGGGGGDGRGPGRTVSSQNMGSRTSSWKSTGSAGGEDNKWNLPNKQLKRIARSGVYTDWCADREELWNQCLCVPDSPEAIEEDRRYLTKTLEAPVPKGEHVDEFYISIPRVPFVDLSKGDYDLIANVTTTKILYAVYQTTGLEYGAFLPLLVGLMREVPLNGLSIFRLVRALVDVCRLNKGLYLDVSLQAGVASAMRVEATLASRMPSIYAVLCRDAASSLKFTMFVVDCFQSFCKPMLHTVDEQLRFLDIFMAEGLKAFCRLFLGVFEMKKAAILKASNSEAFRLLTTDINLEVALQTGFAVKNVSRSHIADADIDPAVMKKITSHLRTIPTFGSANFIPIDYTITRTDRPRGAGKKSVTHESELVDIKHYIQVLAWLPKRFQAVQPRLVYTSSVDGFGLDRLRELSFGVGPSLLVFKTAGRIESAFDAATKSATAGGGGGGGAAAAAPSLPGAEGEGAAGGAAAVDPDEDVTFGVFVAGKWTYDMVKKDVEGDGLDASKYFVFRLGPRNPARVVLDDDDESTVMGGVSAARPSEFFRVMTTRSGISFGCRSSKGSLESESSPPALFIAKNFQSGRSAPYGSKAYAREIVYGEELPVEFRVQCIELISLAL